MATDPNETKIQPTRKNSRLIFIAASITAIFAVAGIWNAFDGPTMFNIGTATFILFATGLEIYLAFYTRKNEERTAHYLNIAEQNMKETYSSTNGQIPATSPTES